MSFKDLPPTRRRLLASLGGKLAQLRGRAHRWTKEEASAAGKKSAELRRQRRAAAASDRDRRA
jgi:hypothetical protein